MTANRKDLASGAVFIAFGMVYGYLSMTSMPLGSATRMGPGFFPAILSALVALMGLIILVRAFIVGGDTPFDALPWRPIVCISLGTILFAAFADDLGMLPATFLTTTIAALARRGTRLWQAALLGLAIAVFCSLVFTFGLGLPLPIFGTLFGH